MDTELPTGGWDTVGGLVFDLLGHVPVQGETVVVDGLELVAERVEGRRIGRVRIVPGRPRPRPTSARDPFRVRRRGRPARTSGSPPW